MLDASERPSAAEVIELLTQIRAVYKNYTKSVQDFYLTLDSQSELYIRVG